MKSSKSGDQPVTASEAPIANNTAGNTIRLNTRLHRLSVALFNKPQSSWDLLHIIGTTNPHEYIRQLRHNYGLTLAYESVKFTKLDGKPSSYNLFYLTPDDREKLSVLLGLEGCNDPKP